MFVTRGLECGLYHDIIILADEKHLENPTMIRGGHEPLCGRIGTMLFRRVHEIDRFAVGEAFDHFLLGDVVLVTQFRDHVPRELYAHDGCALVNFKCIYVCCIGSRTGEFSVYTYYSQPSKQLSIICAIP